MNDDERIRFTLRLNEYLYNKVNGEATVKGVTKNALIAEILWRYFEFRESEASRQ